ncbi:MAG: hypothetical protein HC936_09905 [Leptolyngbyaceae cyanobacterium SU_3_3]|nr:hypothetical protein [Leptolyngbyaceae cyanobacterium SU_3_3]
MIESTFLCLCIYTYFRETGGESSSSKFFAQPMPKPRQIPSELWVEQFLNHLSASLNGGLDRALASAESATRIPVADACRSTQPSVGG